MLATEKGKEGKEEGERQVKVIVVEETVSERGSKKMKKRRIGDPELDPITVQPRRRLLPPSFSTSDDAFLYFSRFPFSFPSSSFLLTKYQDHRLKSSLAAYFYCFHCSGDSDACVENKYRF